MPEGPELHMTMLSINKLCQNVIFSGKVVRNPIHKCEDVRWDEASYEMKAESRGKELMLHLQQQPPPPDSSRGTSAPCSTNTAISILFTFGMSGKFALTPAQELLKHSHLSFFTKEAPRMALSFVDPRRFGKWRQTSTWSTGRGPCVIQEYDSFVQNILSNLGSPAFSRPICELLLDQQFFHGIGNYLRAEVLYRCQVPPFVEANSVLRLQDGISVNTSKYFQEERPSQLTFDMLTPKGQELLRLCHVVPLEVVNLGSSKYSLLDLTTDDTDGLFAKWLRCYNQAGMKSLIDHKKRTIWFSGPAGPLVPKEQKTRKAKTSMNTKSARKDKTKIREKANQMPSDKQGQGMQADSIESISTKRSTSGNRRTREASTARTGAHQNLEESPTDMSVPSKRKMASRKHENMTVDKDGHLNNLENDNSRTRVRRSTRKVKL